MHVLVICQCERCGRLAFRLLRLELEVGTAAAYEATPCPGGDEHVQKVSTVVVLQSSSQLVRPA